MNTNTTPAPFAYTAPYYDLIYGKRDVTQTAKKIIHHARALSHTQKRLSMLDIGCGTGAYTIELWRQGVHITGIDQSDEMLQIARAKAREASADIEFIPHNFLSFKTTKAYDVVVSLFDVVSYVTATDDVKQFFHKAAAAMPNGGVFIFDCWYGPGVLLSKPKIIRQKYKNSELEVLRKKTPVLAHAVNTVSIHHELSIRRRGEHPMLIRETHVMRYFFYPELETLAADAGLRIIHWGNLELVMHPPKTAPWSIWVIAQKQT